MPGAIVVAVRWRDMGTPLRAAAIATTIAAALAMTTAAAAAASNRVVGGSSLANPGWAALLNIDYPGGDVGLCGGELVASAWVLTAAHCVMPDGGSVVSPDAIGAWVGLDRASQATNADAQVVDRVVVDPSYNAGTSYGDLAALHLAALDPHTPLALGSSTDTATGTPATVLGFGVTNVVFDQTSDALQQVAAPILDGVTCSGAYAGSYDPTTMICAGGVRGQDSCNGDSGGPLAFAPSSPAAELLGTVDYGSQNCGDGSPAVYQRVTAGAGATFLAATLPTVGIAPSTTAPPKQSTITATAATAGITGPSYSWDLDGNGSYGDATGPSVSIPIGPSAVSVGVRATGSDGDGAARRITIAPQSTTVSATVPSHVTEGHTVLVTLATSGPGSGTVAARATGHGLSASATAAVPAGRSLSLRLPNDHVWHAPRRIQIALAGTAQLTLASAAPLTTTFVDNDKPRLRITKARRSTSRQVAVTSKPPGTGTVTLRVMRGTRTLARHAFRVTGTTPRGAHVSLTAAEARSVSRGHATVHASWRSSSSPVATATAARKLR
jgi:secreted trypsin-like serine protease